MLVGAVEERSRNEEIVNCVDVVDYVGSVAKADNRYVSTPASR